MAVHDTEESYWDTLARAYSLPVDLIKLMYEEWDPNEHQRFSDFVKAMQTEAGYSDDEPVPFDKYTGKATED
jgi:hypothetical protein